MNEKLKKEILKIVDQPAETSSLIGSEKDKGIEGKKYQTYKEGIQEFIAGLDLTLADGETKVKRSQEEMTQFGSVTAGIVALSDLHELSDEGHIEERNYLREDGKINAGKIRQLADNIGEEAKKDIHYKTEINEKGERVLVGDSGRGTVEGVDYFMKQSSLRALEQKVKELGHENKILLSEKEKLSEELRKLRALLKNRQYEEKHEEQLQNIRGRIKEIG